MKTVFFDIDTQIDFLFPAGALYAPGAEAILPSVAKLNHYAAQHEIPVISSMDAHSENDPEFKEWPPHCVVGTTGQQKPAQTLLEKRVVVPNLECSPGAAHHFLLEKQTFSCFSNVNLMELLRHFQAERFVVYGLVTEVCVKYAVFGLLETGKRVEVATDAICAFNPEAGAQALADFKEAGAHLVDHRAQLGITYA